MQRLGRGDVNGSGGQCSLAAAVEDRAWNGQHGMKELVGDKVCLRQQRRVLVAAADIKNEGRPGPRRLAMMSCVLCEFVTVCIRS